MRGFDHKWVREKPILSVQYEGYRTGRIAKLLGKGGQSPRRNAEASKPKVCVSVPDKDAIVQESLLPSLSIKRRSPVGVFAGAYLSCSLGELLVRAQPEAINLKLGI